MDRKFQSTTYPSQTLDIEDQGMGISIKGSNSMIILSDDIEKELERLTIEIIEEFEEDSVSNSSLGSSTTSQKTILIRNPISDLFTENNEPVEQYSERLLWEVPQSKPGLSSSSKGSQCYKEIDKLSKFTNHCTLSFDYKSNLGSTK